MKKITLKTCCFFFVLLSYPLVHAIESTIEVRTAAFYHSSKHFRKIYNNFGPSYEVEASISCDPCCYSLWTNFSWFHKHGKAHGHTCSSTIKSCECSGHPSTTANIANLSLGIKFPYQFNDCLLGYVGIGPSFGTIWLKNHTHHHHKERTSKFAFGGIVKLGVNYFITQCVFLDLFVDYIYQPVDFKTQIDIGGVKAGVGLGFRF